MNWKKISITVFRLVVGWHFLYEGLSKLLTSNWSATSYLLNSTGPFSGFYHWLGSSEDMMRVIDPVNIGALILIGLGLSIGLAIRTSIISGVFLLFMYYFAYPPFGGYAVSVVDGNLFIVNRNMVEAMALILLLVSKEKGYGLFALKFSLYKRKVKDKESEAKSSEYTRRDALKNLVTLPVLGVLGVGAYNVKQKYGTDTLSGATIKVGGADIKQLKGELPKGKINDHEISRLVMGGNLIGGWSHSRDLRYVSSLFRAYNTEKKIFETLQLAEQAGVNTINIGFPTNATMQKYKKVTGSKIKVISQVGHDRKGKDHFVNINKAIDFGVDIIQVIGNSTDVLVRDGKIDVVDKMITEIRRQGYTAGVGAHALEALITCHDMGIIPDYYMKTMHHDQYWSAHPRENRHSFEVMGGNSSNHNEYHDNLFCSYPDKTVEFVNRVEIPVMGFKVLAAGAIEPKDGFNWAIKNGADFICVGMFDFQLVNNVNTMLDVLDNLEGRNRKWFG